SLKQSQADRDGLSEQLRVSDQRSQELQARLSFLEDQAREQAERKAEQGNSVSAEVAALKRALADKEAELEIVRGSRAASESSEADANRTREEEEAKRNELQEQLRQLAGELNTYRRALQEKEAELEQERQARASASPSASDSARVREEEEVKRAELLERL